MRVHRAFRAHALIRLSAVLLVASAAAACKDEVTMSSTAGVYALQSIGGASLPATTDVSTSGGTTTTTKVNSATLNLNASGTWTFSGNFTITQTGSINGTTQASGTDTGTWTLSGNTITIKSNSDNSTDTGTVDGNTISATLDGKVWVFKK